MDLGGLWLLASAGAVGRSQPVCEVSVKRRNAH
jgi:hypothetical protein